MWLGDVTKDQAMVLFRFQGSGDTVDDLNPALPFIRNIPQFS